MLPLYPTNDIRAWDEFTRQEKQWTPLELIRHAGFQLFKALLHLRPTSAYEAVVVFPGPGHNGDDALVMAAHLAQLDLSVMVCLRDVEEDTSIRGVLLREAVEQGALHIQYLNTVELESKRVLMIDGLFGIGLTRPIQGYFEELIAQINMWRSQHHAHVVSIDLPSGYAEGKSAQGPHVMADITLVVQAPHLTSALPDLRMGHGRTYIVDIQLSDQYLTNVPSRFLWLQPFEDVSPVIFQSSPYDHKYGFGRVAVVSGSPAMIGAGILASHASLVSGTGSTYCYVPVEGRSSIHSRLPEAIVIGGDHDEITVHLNENIHQFTSLLIGPGMGPDISEALLRLSLRSSHDRPTIFDADALNALAQRPALLAHLGKMAVLTPHVGEFHRLFGKVDHLQDRWLKASRHAQELGCAILIKDAHSALCLPDGSIEILASPNEALAIPGSGDVLVGYAAGLSALGLHAVDAIRTAAILHNLSGWRLRRSHGARGGLASGLIDHLSRVRAWYPALQEAHSTLPYPPLWLDDFMKLSKR